MTESTIRNQKGMASVKDMPILQDGPPSGGFPAIRYARRIPNSGPAGVAVFLVSSAVIAFGFYQVGQGNIHRRALKEEKITARQAILPVIQAEADSRFVTARKAQLEEEERLMAHVPGWKTGENVYNSGRWMPPSNGKMMVDLS